MYLKINPPCEVRPFTCSADSIGYIMAVGRNKKETFEIINKALSKIRWEYE